MRPPSNGTLMPPCPTAQVFEALAALLDPGVFEDMLLAGGEGGSYRAAAQPLGQGCGSPARGGSWRARGGVARAGLAVCSSRNRPAAPGLGPGLVPAAQAGLELHSTGMMGARQVCS